MTEVQQNIDNVLDELRMRYLRLRAKRLGGRLLEGSIVIEVPLKTASAKIGPDQEEDFENSDL